LSLLADMHFRPIHTCLLLGFLGGAQAADEGGQCTPILRAGYVIDRPGAYCLSQNVNLRLDFADHSAEHAIVEIMSSDVVLDMRGYAAAAGKWLGVFPQHTGDGIHIGVGPKYTRERPYRNIVIRNGEPSNFERGVVSYNGDRVSGSESLSIEKIGKDEYFYAPANIRLVNIKFVNCDVPLDFRDTED
jgi:hypothetical protein